MIKIYNTLTKKKEEFIPLNEGKVKMYVCGPTVYNYIHLGNARPFVVFDTVRRYLEYKGFDVTYVQNFTDVDDRIINKAKESGKSANEITENFIEHYYNDVRALGVKKADVHPKVTENMDEIIYFIQQLINQENAYTVNGDVYFRTKSFKDYGKLSKQSTDDLIAGARVEIDEKKEDSLDFALWKTAKHEEISWNSPWGSGRPGWHIECSAMAKKYLGETIDIHAGGADLIFPHHENEIAQSESLNHKPFARYWMHNGYITLDSVKMSKSLGNIFTVRELLAKFDPNVLRFLILSIHYRSPMNFSEDLVQQAKSGLERIKTSYINLLHRMDNSKEDELVDQELHVDLQNLAKRFEEEMDDDFNTANAIAIIFDLVKRANLYLQNEAANKSSILLIINTFENLLSILGLENVLNNQEINDENSWIEDLIKERTEAKKANDWAKADEIRDKLNQLGIIIEDTPQGVRWRKK